MIEIAEKVEAELNGMDDISHIELVGFPCSSLYDVRRQTLLFVLSAIIHLGSNELFPCLEGTEDMLDHIGDCEACIHSLVRQNQKRLDKCLAEGVDGRAPWMDLDNLATVRRVRKIDFTKGDQMETLDLTVEGKRNFLYQEIQDARVTVELLAQDDPAATKFEDLRRCLSSIREGIEFSQWRPFVFKVLNELGEMTLSKAITSTP